MADINSLNKEIADLRKQLGEKPLTPFDPKDLDKALLAVKALRYELRESSSELDYISKSFKNSVDEMSKQNTYLNTAKKSLTSISDISRQVVDYRRGETNLTEKQLKNLQNQARVRFEELKLAIKYGKLGDDNLRDAKAALDEQENFNKALGRTIEIQKEVNKEIGLLGSGLEGVGKALEKMGFAGIAKPISDGIQKTKESRFQLKLNQDAIKEIGKEMAALNKRNLSDAQIRYFGGAELKALLAQKEALQLQNAELSTQTSKYKNIAISLKEQVTLTNMMDFMIGKMVQNFFELNKAQTEFTRETGHSYSYMDASSTSLTTMAQNIKLATALTRQFGMAADVIFTPETIKEATEMVELMGMSEEEAGKLARIAKVNGNELKANNEKIVATVSNFNKLNKTGISGKAVLKDLSNISDAMAMSFKGDAVAMAQTAAEAKKLGLTLSDVDKVAESLLNFEDSISAELEAELLTGKQINLEQARLYALNNDIAGLTKEIADNQEIMGSFSSGNRIQQEAIAKALGMSREDMAKMIYNQQLSKGLSEEQAAKMADVELADMKRLSIQEAINNSMTKMGEALAVPLAMFADIIAKAGEFKSLIVIISALLAGKMLYGLVTGAAAMASQVISARAYQTTLAATQSKETAIAAMKIAGAGATSFGAVAGAIAATLAVATAAVAGFKMMDDGEINNQGRPTLFTGTDTVKIRPDDSIYAAKDGSMKVGTDLLGENEVGINPGGGNKGSSGGGVNVDYNQMASIIGAAVSTAIANVQIATSIYLDSKVLAVGVNTENNKAISKVP